MKNFEIYVNDTYTVGVTGYDAVEVAQDEFTYEILKRKECLYSSNDDYIVEVFYEDTSAKITVTADRDLYLSELDTLIWEAIAEDFIVEVK